MLFPHVETKRTALRPAHSSDGPTVYETLQKAGIATLPERAAFEREHAGNLAAQFFVEQRGQVVGLTSLRDLDQAGRHIRAEILTDAGRGRMGLGAEVTLMTVNYAFAMWNVRKVYFWTTDAEARNFTGPPQLVRKEATLPGHAVENGELTDVHVFAIYREDWEEYGTKLLTRLVHGRKAANGEGR
ncbi:GNAT family N-acetyltransferase [Nonomuraea sp. 10N515B]|uniref:GNAT family N-acetyltransferase n=1 Tax=Nonomuraea sp. 10N515B TaxID=3457422 RepID=UPI003FCC832C